MDLDQGMIETANAKPPIGVVSTDTMITPTVTIGVMTAMDIAVEAATAAAEEVYISVV